MTWPMHICDMTHRYDDLSICLSDIHNSEWVSLSWWNTSFVCSYTRRDSFVTNYIIQISRQYHELDDLHIANSMTLNASQCLDDIHHLNAHTSDETHLSRTISFKFHKRDDLHIANSLTLNESRCLDEIHDSHAVTHQMSLDHLSSKKRSMTDSTENATPPKLTTSRNSNSSIQIQVKL